MPISGDSYDCPCCKKSKDSRMGIKRHFGTVHLEDNLPYDWSGWPDWFREDSE